MFKRTFLATAMGAALLLGTAFSANALVITAGDYKIEFSNYDMGTIGYGSNQGVACNTVSSCNTTAAAPAVGTAFDTAGVVSISVITRLSDNEDVFTRGTSSTWTYIAEGVTKTITTGAFLTGFFGGLDDHYVEIEGSTTTARAVGGFFNVYSNSTKYLPGPGPTGAGVDLDAEMYPLINTSNLFLGGVFAPGAIVGDLVSTYTNKYAGNTFAGNGSGYLDFTGGAALELFNTNSIDNLIGGKADAKLSVTYYEAPMANSPGQAKQPGDYGWDAVSTGQIDGAVGEVPEPGSIALISLAMLGMGAVTRRRNKQSDGKKG